MDLFNILTIVVTLCYIAAAGSISSKLLHHEGPNPKVFLPIGCVAVICHAIIILPQLFIDKTLDVSLLNMVSLMAFLISLTTTVIAFKHKANLILPVSYGFAALLVAAISFIPSTSHVLLDLEQVGLFVHITLALLAYAILAIATLYAFQVNYISFKLKSKNLMAVSHLPPLMKVESQLFNILLAGTICLFISQIIGLIFIEQFLGKAYIHKTVLSFIALFIYITMIWGHYKQGWRGTRILSLALISTSLLTLSYFGSKFVKEFLLT